MKRASQCASIKSGGGPPVAKRAVDRLGLLLSLSVDVPVLDDGTIAVTSTRPRRRRSVSTTSGLNEALRQRSEDEERITAECERALIESMLSLRRYGDSMRLATQKLRIDRPIYDVAGLRIDHDDASSAPPCHSTFFVRASERHHDLVDLPPIGNLIIPESAHRADGQPKARECDALEPQLPGEMQPLEHGVCCNELLRAGICRIDLRGAVVREEQHEREGGEHPAFLIRRGQIGFPLGRRYRTSVLGQESPNGRSRSRFLRSATTQYEILATLGPRRTRGWPGGRSPTPSSTFRFSSVIDSRRRCSRHARVVELVAPIQRGDLHESGPCAPRVWRVITRKKPCPLERSY